MNSEHFGLFWLDIWSWGGKYTVYNKLQDVPYLVSNAEAAALLGINESQLTKPLSYHLPWGLVIIVGLMLLKFLPRFLAKRRQARAGGSQFHGGGSPPGWSPQPVPPGQPPMPPAGGPPPIPPPLPPEQ